MTNYSAGIPFRHTLALMLVLTALGIGVFWWGWFRATSTDAEYRSDIGTDLPPAEFYEHPMRAPGIFYYGSQDPSGGIYYEEFSYNLFEHAFPLPDLFMAAVMIVLALLYWLRRRSAIPLTFIVVGMAWTLASLDVAYHLQHEGFAVTPSGGNLSRLFITVYLYVLGGMLLASASARHPTFDIPSMLRFRIRCVAAYALVFVPLLLYCILGVSAIDPVYPMPLLPATYLQFQQAFLFVDAGLMIALLVGIWGILQRPELATITGLVCCGVFLFEQLIRFAFAMLIPEMSEGFGMVPALHFTLAVVALIPIGLFWVLYHDDEGINDDSDSGSLWPFFDTIFDVFDGVFDFLK